MIHAFAATSAKGRLEPIEFALPPLGADEIDIAVEFCGVCHSDLSMLRNEFRISKYPLVPGHEVIGTVAEIGSQVKHLSIGQRVGLGWYSRSCLECHECLSGDHNLCQKAEQTIVGRYGGFASRVRCQSAWAVPLPPELDPLTSGPLFCGGITVFNPIVQFGVRPTDRVGVIGLGGLGHLALQFLRAWGCEVTAFSSNPSKAEELKKLGAHHVVSSTDASAIGKLTGSMQFILSTVNASLDWSLFINALAPRGRLHFVGIAPEPVSTHVFPLLVGQRSLSGSPLGSPATTMTMLEFCARHSIAPMTELFPLSEVNEALAHLEGGKARYRVVLQNDLG